MAKSTRWSFTGAAGDAAISAAVESGDINDLDGAKLREHLKLVARVIRVDEFPPNSHSELERRPTADEVP